MTIVCTQIAGILARRIVCRVKEGDNLTIGEKFGMIKFSSRTDVLMPTTIDTTVKVGDKVKGGQTIIGKMAASSGGNAGSPPAGGGVAEALQGRGGGSREHD